MEQANLGASALAAGNTSLAISHYTKALIEHPISPDYHTQRSTCFTRLSPPRHDLALADAEIAVLCGQKRGKRDKIQAAQQRRVICLYNTARYADAKFVLETMQKWRAKDNRKDKMENDIWMAKIEPKLKTPDADKSRGVKEYPEDVLPDEQVLREKLKKQLKTDGSYNFDKDIGAVHQDLSKDMEFTNTPPSSQQTMAEKPSASTTSVPPQKIRHEWYQSPTAVTFTIYAKGVSKDAVMCEIAPDSLSISFPQPGNLNSTFDMSFDPLFASIDTLKSSYRVLSTKIEILLAKSVTGLKWSSMEGTEKLRSNSNGTEKVKSTIPQHILTGKSEVKETAPVYPTSSKTGPKNWDKITDDLDKKHKQSQKAKRDAESKANKKKLAEKNDNKEGSRDDESAGSKDDSDVSLDDTMEYDSDDGGDNVDSFFSKLYKDADPDTQRAMKKSMYESNGTSLSTSWSDVGSRYVDEVKSKDDK